MPASVRGGPRSPRRPQEFFVRQPGPANFQTLYITGEGDGDGPLYAGAIYGEATYAGAPSASLTESAVLTSISAGVGGSSDVDLEILAVTSTGAGVGAATSTLADRAVLTGLGAGVGLPDNDSIYAAPLYGEALYGTEISGALAEKAALAGISAGVGGSVDGELETLALTGEGDGIGGSLGAVGGGQQPALPLFGGMAPLDYRRVQIPKPELAPRTRIALPVQPPVPEIVVVRATDDAVAIALFAAEAINDEEFAALIAA